MTFRDALAEHLRALRGRDHAALMETVAADPIVLVTSDGRLVRSPAEFAEMHRGWFESPTWSLDFEEVGAFESADLAVVTLRLEYRDRPAGGDPIRERSLLTLAFRREGDRWRMVLDQNTPTRAPGG